jgi:hypothetical protein
MSSRTESSWEIHPYVGIGILRFGQTRSEVRSLIGNPSKSFKKVPFAENEADAYNSLGFHLYYDTDDRLESVDAWGPSPICFDGIKLVDVPVDSLARELAERGFEHHSYWFDRAGFSLYVVDEVAKCATVFARGYYDMTNTNSAVNRVARAAEAWRKSRRLP